MAGRARSEVERGQAIYNPLLLKVYDTMILRVSTPLVWGCRLARLQRHYDDNVGARHCDIGVGTGYFLDKASWPGTPSITLVDLNPGSLASAGRRIERFSPETVTADALEPLPDDMPSAPFDSVGLGYLLHCVPGEMPDKAARVFANVAHHLAPGGVVFGSTILSGGVKLAPHARALAGVYNRKGIFHNAGDSLDGLTEALGGSFDDHTLEVSGAVALFAGRTPAAG
jgi:SAM-dependent methyltransferase